MAEYTNLTSLKKLKEGDVITYDTTTTIDFNGAVVKVELYGKKGDTTKSGTGGNGGYISFIFNPENIKIFSFNSRGDLIYGESSDLYYRIAVAGDGGDSYYNYNITSSTKEGGDGGGVSGRNVQYGPTGGSQTSGGTASGKNSPTNGSFGAGGKAGSYSSSYYGGDGGYGWYGGGAGGSQYNDATAGAGGSGFIIGTSTTTYPAGYLGDDTTLQTKLAAAITEGVLTQGGSTETTPKMIITIIKPGANGLPFYNGKEYTGVSLNFYDGSQFRKCNVFYYDGNTFKPIEGGSE